MAPLLLVGDIGGTKTDLAVVSAGRGPRERLAERRFASNAHAGLETMAHAFLQETGLKVDAACFDVAGPVITGEARLTNLSWRLTESALADALGIRRVWLLNDLVATASAIPELRPDEVDPVKDGEPLAGSAIAVLAPGTGLGEAFLTHDADGYRAHASEGGHSAFSPTTDVEIELLSYLSERADHVSFERVASGIGIPNLYEFLRDRRGLAESPPLAATLAATQDRTRPIIDAALEPSGPDPLARATLDLFLHILGVEGANLALKVLATGGIYLAGGIAQRLGPLIRTSPFADGLTDAGRFRPMLERMPVYVVRGDVALLGVAREGLRLMALG